jgi:diguanylate cyclase (GGDEF)-like protein
MSRMTVLIRLIAGVALVNLLAVAIVAMSLVESRHQASARAAILLEGMTRVAEQSLTGFLGRIDLTLRVTAEEVGAAMAAGASRGEIEAVIVRQFHHHDSMDSLRIADAAGQVLYGTGIKEGEPVNIADRDYFQRAQQDTEGGVLISQPMIGRISGKWVVVLARRITGADGTFRGAVFAVVTLERMRALFRGLALGPKGVVTFLDPAMRIILRDPEPQGPGSALGTTIIAPEFEQLRRQQPEGGVYRVRNRYDGIERFMGYRQTAVFPGYLFIGIGEEDVLGEWRREAWGLTGLMLLLFFLTIVGSLLIYRGWQNQREVTATLDALNHELSRHARTDALTGCANRRYFLELLDLERQRAWRYGTAFCILALDLDHFKDVNDRYGHLGGDNALCSFTQVIGAMLRPTDILGRMGGEEFQILLPESVAESAETLAERIRVAVERTVVLSGGDSFSVTVSIGVAQWRREDSIESLLSRADNALYAAKDAGRNRVRSETDLPAAATPGDDAETI